MFAKAPMATHIVSQLCFDARRSPAGSRGAATAHAPADLDRRAGKVPHASSCAYREDRVGESARFLRHHGKGGTLFIRQFKPTGWYASWRRPQPTQPPAWPDPPLHVNEVAGTERWRRATLERLSGSRLVVERLNQQRRDVGDTRPEPFAAPSSITVAERAGHRQRIGSGSAASRPFLVDQPGASSIHMWAPPAPQQNVRCAALHLDRLADASTRRARPLEHVVVRQVARVVVRDPWLLPFGCSAAPRPPAKPALAVSTTHTRAEVRVLVPERVEAVRAARHDFVTPPR